MKDADHMALAISLAEKGRGWTSPNPVVGAVIVKEGRIIGQGYHRRCGEAHAERNALADCRESPAGATLYVTLEPCCHQGRQPPCTEAILAAGVRRVVVGSVDPNPWWQERAWNFSVPMAWRWRRGWKRSGVTP